MSKNSQPSPLSSQPSIDDEITAVLGIRSPNADQRDCETVYWAVYGLLKADARNQFFQQRKVWSESEGGELPKYMNSEGKFDTAAFRKTFETIFGTPAEPKKTLSQLLQITQSKLRTTNIADLEAYNRQRQANWDNRNGNGNGNSNGQANGRRDRSHQSDPFSNYYSDSDLPY